MVCLFACDLSANGADWSTVRALAASIGIKVMFFTEVVVFFVPSSVASKKGCSQKSSGFALAILCERDLALLIGEFFCGASVDGIGGRIKFFLG